MSCSISAGMSLESGTFCLRWHSMPVDCPPFPCDSARSVCLARPVDYFDERLARESRAVCCAAGCVARRRCQVLGSHAIRLQLRHERARLVLPLQVAAALTVLQAMHKHYAHSSYHKAPEAYCTSIPTRTECKTVMPQSHTSSPLARRCSRSRWHTVAGPSYAARALLPKLLSPRDALPLAPFFLLFFAPPRPVPYLASLLFHQRVVDPRDSPATVGARKVRVDEQVPCAFAADGDTQV